MNKFQQLFSGLGKEDSRSLQGVLIRKDKDQRYLLEPGTTTIGRDEGADVCIEDDPHVSRHHALVTAKGNSYYLEDSGSANGTFLNGKRLSGRKELTSGDRVKVGRTELIYELADLPADFGHYQIISQLGRGGMGIVYKAIDRRDRRKVAIKQLILEGVDESRAKNLRDRFRREALVAARFSHPNIVSVYAVETSTESCYYVMELLEGTNLRREIERKHGPMLPRDFLPIFQQVAEALEYAHQRKVIHRDVKPDNIFILEDGRVKIADFGIAAVTDMESTLLTKSGFLLGTPAYLSPEQLKDARRIDHRADLYSLAVVGYECLSGQLPFSGEGIAGTAYKIISEEAPLLSDLVPNVSEATAAVIAKAMHKQASERYQSVLEFLDEFRQSLGQGAEVYGVARAPDAGPSPQGQGQDRIGGANMMVVQFGPAAAPYDGETLVSSEGELQEALRQEAIRQVTESALSESVQTDPGEGQIAAANGQGVAPPAQKVEVEEAHAADGTETTVPQAPPAKHPGETTVRLAPVSEYLVKAIGTIGGPGQSDGCFSEPFAVATYLHRVLVADAATGRLQTFSLDGRWLANVKLQGEVERPAGDSLQPLERYWLSADCRGWIYRARVGDNTIRVFDSRGRFLKEITNSYGGEAGIGGLASDAGGFLYAADASNGCIQVFSSQDGSWVRKVGAKSTALWGLQAPGALTIDSAGRVYVLDMASSRLSIFDRHGAFVGTFGGQGTANGLFNAPCGVAVDRHGLIYISDSLNHRVQVFAPNGEWVYALGEKGGQLGQFLHSGGICIDPELDCLYVTDRGNQRVQMFELRPN